MPIYNVEKYLKEAIESVLNQTYTDFELILVNDGSKDSSVLIAENFLENDNRIKIIHQENSGLSAARNSGIKVASGNYVYFMDSDDYIKNDTLEKLEKIVTSNNVEVVFFNTVTFLDYDNESTNVLEKYTNYYDRLYLEEKEYKAVDYYEVMSRNNNFVASACLQIAKLEIIKNNKLLFKTGIINEDELYTRELLFSVKKVFYCKEKFYFRRIREFSITTSVVKEIKPISLLTIAERLFTLGAKTDNTYLKQDANWFFNESIYITEKNFRNNSILRSRLLKSKLFFKIPNQRKRILILNFPKILNLFKTIFK